VDALLREGIDHVFGIPAHANLAIIDALRDTLELIVHQRRFTLRRRRATAGEKDMIECRTRRAACAHAAAAVLGALSIGAVAQNTIGLKVD
jgi:hypothetical protein